MGKPRYQASPSPSGNTLPCVDVQSALAMALALALGMAALLVFWRGATPAADSARMEMAAANPAQDTAVEANDGSPSVAPMFEQDTESSVAVQQSAAIPDNTAQQATEKRRVRADESASDRRPIRLWRSKHLANRHYAAITSRTDRSELSYLCMEGVSCGWILDLKNDKACNKDQKGKVFTIRVQAPVLVRDFESKCIAYGLVSLAFNASEKSQLNDMIRASESLVFSSVDNSINFRSQHYDFPGSVDAINSARFAAGIDQDNRSL